jgi:hypothetical protein
MDGTAMPAIRVLQGTISGVKKHYGAGGGPFGLLLGGVTFRIGSPSQLVTIGGAALDLLEGEYLAVAVTPGLFSDRGSAALAYRRLGQKADAQPAGGFSGILCLLSAAIVLYRLARSGSLSAQPVLATVSAALVLWLILLGLYRRRLARTAAQTLARLSLERPPLLPVQRTAATPAVADSAPIGKDPLRWVVVFGALLVVLGVAGLEGLFARAHDVRTAQGLAPLLIMVLILFGVLIFAYFVPPSAAEVRWHDSAQGKWARGAVGILVGALALGGGIYLGRHDHYYLANRLPSGRGAFVLYICTWLWDGLGDTFGPWGPGCVTMVAGLALCSAGIAYLRRA